MSTRQIRQELKNLQNQIDFLKILVQQHKNIIDLLNIMKKKEKQKSKPLPKELQQKFQTEIKQEQTSISQKKQLIKKIQQKIQNIRLFDIDLSQ